MAIKRRSARGNALAAALIAVGVLAVPARALAATPSTALCANISNIATIPAPPQGMASTQVWTLGTDCQLHAGPVQFVDEASVPGLASQQISSIGAGAGGAQPLTTSHAYVVSRSWDCCGILLNEYSINISWAPSTGGSNITSWSAYDAAKWHREACCGFGWYLGSGDHSLGASSGGVGQASVTVHGHQGFGYWGSLDPTGSVFYNTYDSWIEGKPGWTYGTCTRQIVWRHGAPGWSMQSWCNPGTYS